MNKFEQVSSDDHQMSVAGSGGRVSRSPVPLRYRVSRFHICEEIAKIKCDLHHQIPLKVCARNDSNLQISDNRTLQ